MYLRLCDLSPVSNVEDYAFMPFKSYFDGGNKADSTQYDVLTLAVMSGSAQHWKDFEDRWRKVLRAHGANWLHTTDAVSLQDEYKGWTKRRVNEFITDCTEVIERCAAQRTGRKITYWGIRPATITVVLNDYKRAMNHFPNLGAVEQLCAVQAAVCAMTYGRAKGFVKFQFFFDQNEPFYGHIRDRMVNKRSVQSSPDWKHVVTAEANMRDVPALQAADLMAWSVSRKNDTRHDWQKRVLAIDRDQQWVDYSTLLTADADALARIESFRLPPRRQMK